MYGFIRPLQNDEEMTKGIAKQSELVEQIIRYVALLQYLEKEGLALFFEPATDDRDVIEFGNVAINLPSFSMKLDDINTVELLIEYSNKQILPTIELKELESNKFISTDEMRYRKNNKLTIVALVLSFVLGLYGMINNHLNSKSQQIDFQKSLEENSKNTQLIVSQLAKLGIENTPNDSSFKNITKELNENIIKLKESIHNYTNQKPANSLENIISTTIPEKNNLKK